MHKSDAHDEMEKALLRLMPTALGEAAQRELETRLDELAAEGKVIRYDFSRWAKWLGGIAALVVMGVFMFPMVSRDAAPMAGVAVGAGMVLIDELDRVGEVRDEGLFIDAEGSALRKMSVRVMGESRILDQETGIEITLTEPRQEMYLLPVSNF